MITITRKIQIRFDTEDKEEKTKCWETWYNYQRIVRYAANHISTHMYVQSSLKDLFYFTEDFKVTLGNAVKSPEGVLTTSRENTTYQVISNLYKGDCPTGILAALNQTIVKTFKKEYNEIRSGKKSLRTYSRDIPIPFMRSNMRQVHKKEDGNYGFILYGFPFVTYFGKDYSGNSVIIDNAFTGKYKLCDSSIQIKKNKMFLLAVVQFEKEKAIFDPDNVCEALMDVEIPIRFKIKRTWRDLGNKEEFLQSRQKIAYSLERVKRAIKYTNGGHGRKKKLRPLLQFRDKEKHFVSTRIHQYTAELIKWCVKMKCGTLILKDAHIENEGDKIFLRRYASFSEIKEKLSYKCKREGIELIIEE